MAFCGNFQVWIKATPILLFLVSFGFLVTFYNNYCASFLSARQNYNIFENVEKYNVGQYNNASTIIKFEKSNARFGGLGNFGTNKISTYNTLFNSSHQSGTFDCYRGIMPIEGSWIRVERLPLPMPPWEPGPNGCLLQGIIPKSVFRCMIKSPLSSDWGSGLYAKERVDDIKNNGFLEYSSPLCLPGKIKSMEGVIRLYENRSIIFAGDSTSQGHYRVF